MTLAEINERAVELDAEADALLAQSVAASTASAPFPQSGMKERRKKGVELHGKLERLVRDLDKLEDVDPATDPAMVESTRKLIAHVASKLLQELFSISGA